MTTRYQESPQVPEQSPDKLSGVENLYIGRFEQMGTINDGDLEVRFKGEFLLYRVDQGNGFKFEHVRRVALYGMPEPGSDYSPPLGVISLAGPVARPRLEAEVAEQEVYKGDVHLQLHYRTLSERRALSRTRDSRFPTVERIGAKLVLTQEETVGPDELEVKLNASLQITGLIHKTLGRVENVGFEKFPVSFSPAGRGPSLYASQLNSLHGCPEPGEECQKKNEPYNKVPTTVYELPLKFVNVSSSNPEDLEAACQTQIDGACEVWQHKAALRLVVKSKIEDAADNLKAKYKIANPELQSWLPCAYAQSNPNDKPCENTPTDPDLDRVEIYLVDKITDSPYGGAARDDGQASAYCILAVNEMPKNKYLLAHELGHVLGVGHPRTLCCPGSSGSVMHPKSTPPFFSDNTRENCKILAPRFADMPPRPCLSALNAIVRATQETKNFCLDG